MLSFLRLNAAPRETTSVPAKLRNWIAWRCRQVASLPSQIASGFSDLPFVEENILYPRYKDFIGEHESKLPALDSMDSRIVDELERTGICVTSLKSLNIPNTPEFLEAAKKISQDLAKNSSQTANKGKYEIHATSAQLMRHVELFHWGLEDRLLKIIERYLGLPVAYDGLLFFLSIADGREEGARAWHKDREDRRMVKVCVYLNDVNDRGGPFQNLQPEINSLQCNSVKDRYKAILHEDIEKIDPAAAADGVISCTGPAGTVIFVDTARNYHRGKPPTESSRSAIFFSYFSRKPWHPFFCQRSPFSSKDLECLTQGISSDQKACVHWKDNLPKTVKWIPKNRI